MAAFVNIGGPIVANTVYVDNKLVARDVSATLPEVMPVTIDVQAMGTWSLPIWQLLEDMQLTITKIGVDLGLRSMLKPEPLTLEMRFVQTVTDANGATKPVSCKAFMRGIPASMPGIGVAIGEASENEVNYSVTRYQLMVDGTEYALIDRLAGKLKINGKDYAAEVVSML